MIKYHKINSVFKRDSSGRFMEDQFSQPEFEFLYDNVNWVGTEKLDGTNIRISPYEFDDYDGVYQIERSTDILVEFAGRTDKAQIPEFLSDYLAETFTAKKFDGVFHDLDKQDVILFGEGIGNKIQKVGKLYKPDGVEFVLFDIQIGSVFLKRTDVVDIAETLGIKVAPTRFVGTLKKAVELVRKGIPSNWGDFEAEGLVLRPEVELNDRLKNRVVTKVKTKDFEKGERGE